MKRKIKEMLQKIGFSEKEIEVFTVLGRCGPLKGTEITKQLGMNRGQAYRILKELEKKGVIETTLESPKRFVASSFETIIDSYIKSRKEEVERIEQTKDELLSDWNALNKIEVDASLEKFCVIEGKKKIFRKIIEMLKNTSNVFTGALTLPDLIEFDKHEILTSLSNQQLMSRIQIQLLTKYSKENMDALKLLKKNIPSKVILKTINTELGLTKFTRMIIRDNKEIIVFIANSDNRKEVCLWTNCKIIVQSFFDVFRTMWQDSIDITQLIKQTNSGKLNTISELIKDPKVARKIWNEFLKSATEEILIVTSSEGLHDLLKIEPKLNDLSENNVRIKIMAPITTENLSITKTLMTWCEIKHIPLGYYETAIIDGSHLFHFNRLNFKGVGVSSDEYFKNTNYTNNSQHIQKTKKMFFDIWEEAHKPSPFDIRSISHSKIMTKPHNDCHELLKKSIVSTDIQYNKEGYTSNKIREKIKKEQKLANKNDINWNDTLRYFGSRAFSVINESKILSLPKMLVCVFHYIEPSSFGPHNILIIDLWKENKEGGSYVPVVLIQDTTKPFELRKRIFKGVIDEENFKILKNNEFAVRMKGNTLFVGWSVPIHLQEHKITIPPCCLLFEGYGEIKSGKYTNSFISGRAHEFCFNSVDAFVTLFHPNGKYVGAGTEGFIDVESVLISKPIC